MYYIASDLGIMFTSVAGTHVLIQIYNNIYQLICRLCVALGIKICKKIKNKKSEYDAKTKVVK